MPRFMHMSRDNVVITKENFKAPKLKKGFSQHSFNIDGALYLSQIDNDNPETSMWLKLWELVAKHTDFYRKRLQTREQGSFEWKDGTPTYLDLDYEKHQIYLVDTPEDLVQLFIKYGNYRQFSHYNHETYTREKYEHENLRIKTLGDLLILNEFIDTLDPLSQEQLRNPDSRTAAKFAKLITSRNTRNMPLVKFNATTIIAPKKGITCEFLVDLLRTKLKLENILGDQSDLRIRTKLDSINFRKIKREGYNGIYYSRNLVKFNEMADEDTTYKPLQKFVDWQSFITKPEIAEIPDFIPFCEPEDKEKIKVELTEYITWLGADTLMLWSWPF